MRSYVKDDKSIINLRRFYKSGQNYTKGSKLEQVEIIDF